MDSVKTRTKVYLLILSLIMSLMGIAYMKSSQSGSSRGQKTMTSTQELEGLEKAAPKSPEMDKFIQREKAAREANQEATGELPK